MAQTGQSVIQLYHSSTASAVPLAGDLAAGELAINTTDEKLYFENNGGTVKLLSDANVVSNALLKDGSVVTTGSLQIGATFGVIFEGTTADAFETTLLAGEPTADRDVTMPDATTTLAGLAVAETFTAPQRGTVTTDNDLSFDQNATNNFKCTPSSGGTLTFTNHTAGQSGFVLLVNGSNYAIAAAATTKISTADLTRISATGTYLISYFDDGTNAYCVASASVA